MISTEMEFFNFNGKELIDFNDPFKKENTTSIHIYCYPKDSYDKFIWKGFVEFSNGNTKGEQKFQAKNIGDLLYKMKTFIDAL